VAGGGGGSVQSFIDDALRKLCGGAKCVMIVTDPANARQAEDEGCDVRFKGTLPAEGGFVPRGGTLTLLFTVDSSCDTSASEGPSTTVSATQDKVTTSRPATTVPHPTTTVP